MKKGFVITDTHLGLTTDELNRDDEIIGVLKYFFKFAVKKKADFIILCGDQFHTNTPSERLIALLISVLNIATKAGIPVYILDGNHETIAKHKRKTCLSFIKGLKKGGYPNLNLIDDVKTIKFSNKTYFTFLPHIAKAHIPKEYDSVQSYVDAKAERLVKKLCVMKHQHWVFSHLNVKDCIPGSEDSMLKKVDVVVPETLTKLYLDKPDTIIINGHIHTRQKKGNIEIVGSPIFVSFGEKEEKKYFLEIHVPEKLSEKKKLIWHESPCKKLVEYKCELNSLSDSKKFIRNFINKIKKENLDLKNSILKVRLELGEQAAGFNTESFRNKLLELCFFVKPIDVRRVLKRVKRNRKQTVNLNPTDAVKLWLKENKPKGANAIMDLALNYIEGSEDENS